MHLELAENLISKEFIKCFKGLIVRKDRPKFIYSDNEETFQTAAKRLRQVTKNEELYEFLIKKKHNMEIQTPYTAMVGWSV